MQDDPIRLAVLVSFIDVRESIVSPGANNCWNSCNCLFDPADPLMALVSVYSRKSRLSRQLSRARYSARTSSTLRQIASTYAVFLGDSLECARARTRYTRTTTNVQRSKIKVSHTRYVRVDASIRSGSSCSQAADRWIRDPAFPRRGKVRKKEHIQSPMYGNAIPRDSITGWNQSDFT